jgi:hypothetical protein
MVSFKFRKAQTLGALAAEDDSLLEQTFVDYGLMASLLDPADPRFLVLGRTGAGKTALLRRIRQESGVGCIDPEELSMQHLQNSTILPRLVQAGVNLDIFYKYLWRHVCVLELIRVRYANEDDVPGTVSRLFDLSLLVNRRKREEKRRQNETRTAALSYLESYGSEYWIRTDTRIKRITQELEQKLETDNRLAAQLGSEGAASAVSLGGKTGQRTAVKLEQELVDRAQAIVSDFLVSDLAKTVKLLGEHGFSDRKNARYIVIDDLDKNWMPHSGMYVGLVKALLHTVRDLNRQLPAAKVIVALRTNVFRRIFASSSTLEPQREKWRDVQLPVRWSDNQLVEFVNKRLEAVARGQFTKAPPELKDFLPHGRSKKRTDAAQYVLDRTLRRPRDVLDFLNTCIQLQGALETLPWSTIRKAEVEYSVRRYAALVEEWKGTYDGLDRVLVAVRPLGCAWSLPHLTDDLLDKLFASAKPDEQSWLARLRDLSLASMCFDEARLQLVNVLVEVGFLVQRNETLPADSTDPMVLPGVGGGEGDLVVHKMFWGALGYADDNPGGGRAV